MPFIVATYIYASSQGQRTHSARTKMPFIVATYVYASSQGQRTHSAQTKMPFIVATYLYASTQGQHTHSARTNFTFYFFLSENFFSDFSSSYIRINIGLFRIQAWFIIRVSTRAYLEYLSRREHFHSSIKAYRSKYFCYEYAMCYLGKLCNYLQRIVRYPIQIK